MSPPCTCDNVTVESVRIACGAGDLEGELAYADSVPWGAAVIAGPHPLLGGGMHNNVVRGLGDGLAAHGLVTLRFNYRGNRPDADRLNDLAAFWRTSRDPAEPAYQADLTAAVAYLRSVVGPDLPLALLGYSFGCTLLPPCVPPGKATPVVLIAPTVGSHDYTSFAALRGPKLIVAPEDDFAADARRLMAWVDALPEPKTLLRPRRDGHFFRGHEAWLADTAADFLNGCRR
jgi:alpha/beta superfamily hydrolase